MKNNDITRLNSVFISRIQLIQNPVGAERLKTITKNVKIDEQSQGLWIKEGSTALSLALLLGFEPYRNRIWEDGTYTRMGKID